MSSEPTTPSEPETTPEEYRQRALLLADLGRYDEAAGEIAAGLAAAPDDPGLLTTLARLHVAAGQAVAALEAADRATAAAPGTLEPLVVRAMALTDDRRYAEAAHTATEILTRWPADAFAQRTGAALLSESRNGQEALNAAWNGVRLAPREAEAHLVLAVVAARLRLFDLAQRGYGEALDLDAGIGDAQRQVGIVRLERRRWAAALEQLADEATLPPAPDPSAPPPGPPAPPSDPTAQPGPSAHPSDPTAQPPGPPAHGTGAAAQPPGPAVQPPGSSPREPGVEGEVPGSGAPDWTGRAPGSAGHGSGSVFPSPEVSLPVGPVLDRSQATADAIRRAVLLGANAVVIAAVVSAVMNVASSGVARMWAGVMGVVILAGVAVWLSRELRPEPIGAVLRRVARRLALVAYATAVAPVLLVVHALVGGPVPLIAAMAVAAVAELVVLTRHA
ncbi:tetratricopeptide repeat protein [Couchioplanes azureus]|uniref:tetratricopeptide repeat protein n=1 Tax=Couchioplanes caeruleus TaxID=56438 RepID=UPI001670E755|nr:tetratricopeptide repeat protein [Couchioplanes caeruleus]GGQ43198.1 hypothetical protein GCM10010166_09370 [Couchioplanes caeruleus subsp. azureus]